MKNTSYITTETTLAQPSNLSKIMKGFNRPSRFDGIHSGSRMSSSGAIGASSNALIGVGRFMGDALFGCASSSALYPPQEPELAQDYYSAQEPESAQGYYSAPEQEPESESESAHESTPESTHESEGGIIPPWLFLPTSPEDAYDQYVLAKQQEIE
jgi:hypothetical protein